MQPRGILTPTRAEEAGVIGRELRGARIQRGIGAAALAPFLGTKTASAVRRIERMEEVPIELALRYAQALGAAETAAASKRRDEARV